MSENEDILIEEVRELPKADRDNTAAILREQRQLSEPLTPDEARKRMAAFTRRNFLIGGAAAAFGILGWRWMSDETKYKLLRSTLEWNERVSQAFYSPLRLAKEFSGDDVTAARVNGDIGLAAEFDPSTWTLLVGGIAGRADDLSLTLEEIKQLPRTDMVIEFKCIEGWSTITHFAGVRFSDFAARYSPHNREPYVSLATPDDGYFVGWDTPAIMHPQTLLAYEMNGRPLRPEHGAPLRLASPTKYGIKQIKRIGRIEFTSERPRDFWAEQGYDWYAGL
ncbi:MAG: molybdopterin-dependent oxidoreductase [Chloracidobacterium sp.]|nr:molybdopterin-dependent oxidoreductase [Chloracidobacterium sp.]